MLTVQYYPVVPDIADDLTANIRYIGYPVAGYRYIAIWFRIYIFRILRHVRFPLRGSETHEQQTLIENPKENA